MSLQVMEHFIVKMIQEWDTMNNDGQNNEEDNVQAYAFQFCLANRLW